MSETPTTQTTVTLIVKTRGRKYFGCLKGGHKAELVIDEVTTNLPLDRIVTIEAEDLTVRSRYGAQLRFRAISVLGERSAEEARAAAAARREAQRWLGYAENDVRAGLARTNAVRQALLLAGAVPDLADRVAALRASVEVVIADEPRREAEMWLSRAILDAEGGLSRTRAIQTALAQAGRYPHLADDLATLQQLLASTAAADAAQPTLRTTIVATPVRKGSRVRVGTRTMVVVSEPRQHRITEDDPSIYGAHLLGYEGDQGWWVECRDLTADEQAEVDTQRAAAEAAAAEYRATGAELQAIDTLIKDTGEKPDGWHTPAGDRYCGGPDLYGSGSWFVVGDEHTWTVHNRGADGDLWDANNVTTGGAGAVGWRVPTTADLVDRIRALDARLNHATGR